MLSIIVVLVFGEIIPQSVVSCLCQHIYDTRDPSVPSHVHDVTMANCSIREFSCFRAIDCCCSDILSGTPHAVQFQFGPCIFAFDTEKVTAPKPRCVNSSGIRLANQQLRRFTAPCFWPLRAALHLQCTRYGLAVGASAAGLVKFLVVVCGVVAWPISKLLDWVLGSEHEVAISPSSFQSSETHTACDDYTPIRPVGFK